MTVLLVLAMFATFLAIEYFMDRKRVAANQYAAETPRPRVLPEIVAGFRLPENLAYHPGHTWALREGPTQVRVGLDDFAVRLMGAVESVELPKRGQWVRQGQRLATVKRNGNTAEVLSPMEGIVTDVNDRIASDTGVLQRDPYGDGWLISVNAPDAKLNFRNLLGNTLSRKWMEEAASRLRARLAASNPSLAPALAQDGGLAVEDVTRALSPEKWTELTREFFLS
jgi:glycine cleavage system H lipoate-binding protein